MRESLYKTEPLKAHFDGVLYHTKFIVVNNKEGDDNDDAIIDNEDGDVNDDTIIYLGTANCSPSAWGKVFEEIDKKAQKKNQGQMSLAGSWGNAFKKNEEDNKEKTQMPNWENGIIFPAGPGTAGMKQ